MNKLDYGVIGNCRTAALVSKTGSIDWCCFPDFDSPSIFSRILDKEKGGSFSILVSDEYTISQYYIENTNILCTSFEAKEGKFEILDFMPRYRPTDTDHYLPPEIYRYFRLKEGTPRFKIVYNPIMNYARDAVVHQKLPDYIRTSSRQNDKDTFYLYSDFDFDDILEGHEIRLTKHAFLMFSYNQKLIPIDFKRVSLEYQRTKIYWLNWNNRSRKYYPYNDEITRSLLILKLMSFQSSGAVLAALTTSIPESIGEVRNWDYRFCWLRDASMSIETLLQMGHQGAAKRFIGFIKRILRSKQDSFQIMYGIRGEKALTEEVLPHLSGFENSRPVRIGNAAYDQKQNDSLGYLLDVIYRYYLHFPGTLDEVEEMWEIVKNIVKSVYSDWRDPDQSIWEFRNTYNHYVFSKVMCWVALDRAISIASLLGRDWYANTWRQEADKIREEVLENGWNSSIQSFSQSYGSSELDSSLLLMEYYGFIDALDERFVKTVKAVQKELFYNGLMFRYKSNDDFGFPSSSFTICTFWLIRGLFVTGEKEKASEIFKEVLAYSNHLGLLSEDLDFETKTQLGNFPQAYSHLALINTALLFSEEKLLSRFIRP